MKISIIGTRGIPNNYGGFEQFAEYLASGLTTKGHVVTVYNSHTHPYKANSWKKVNIIHKYDPEYKIGTAGQFIYDLNCILDLKKHSFDIVLQLGYTSNSIWHFLLPDKPKIITNMDGLEWQRSKYNKLTQRFLKHAERWAAYSSDVLIADSIGIQQHLKETYNMESVYIPYGANIFDSPNEKILGKYGLSPFSYNLLIARFEPENNIELVIEGHLKSSTQSPLVLIGNYENRFGKYLFAKYNNEKKIVFEGPIYDKEALDSLRYFSDLYFHGHSVGGTNPSLLEAMAASCLVCAHNNVFNRSILDKDAFFFNDKNDLIEIINTHISKEQHHGKITNNLNKIRSTYSWSKIIQQYEDVFLNALKT